MNARRFLKVTAVFLGLAMETVSFACPDYATEESRQVIEAMVEAHGGRIAGNHVILNIDIFESFEEERTEQPANAVLFADPLMTN